MRTLSPWLVDGRLLPVSPLCFVCCVLISFFANDASPIGSGPTLMTSRNLSYLFRDPVSRYRHLLRYWGRTLTFEFWGHNSARNTYEGSVRGRNVGGGKQDGKGMDAALGDYQAKSWLMPGALSVQGTQPRPHGGEGTVPSVLSYPAALALATEKEVAGDAPHPSTHWINNSLDRGHLLLPLTLYSLRYNIGYFNVHQTFIMFHFPGSTL